MEHVVLSLALIALLGAACQWVAWRSKLPAILFLLLTGILVGPVLGWLDPDALFGELLFPMVSLGVAVILFEGGITLRFEDIRGLEKVVRRMVTTGVATTWLVAAVAAHWLVGFGWELSFLFGALVVVTGPTVIVPMLRTVRPTPKVAEVLRWEAIVIDPIGALLAVVVYEFLVAQSAGTAFVSTLITFAGVLAGGSAAGAIMGQALGWLLRGHLLPDYLRAVTTLAVVCATFAASNAMAHESGLLAVTVMGIWLANMKNVPLEDILDFKESLSVLLISVLFIVLAARLHFDELKLLGTGAIGVFLVIQFVARPLKIALTTIGSQLSWREKALLSWIAPRGIIAAAVSALFAPKLEALGFEQAHFLVPLTFVVIIGTVVLQSATAGVLAGWLGVAEPEPKGVLIVGANPVARAIGKALQDAGFRILLADNYWESVSKARLAGLRTFYGNPVSAMADRQLDLVGVGKMIGLSPQPELNALAAVRYRAEFGRNAVFRLPEAPRKNGGKEERGPDQGRILFSEDADYDRVASLLGSGELRGTQITESFKWDAYRTQNPEALVLFSLDDRKRLTFVEAGAKFQAKEGWTVYAVHPKPAPADKA